MYKVINIVISVAVISIFGCAALRQGEGTSHNNLAKRYHAMADFLELHDELQHALYYRKIVMELCPKNKTYQSALLDIQSNIKNQAEMHYTKALKAVNQYASDRAQSHLLTALRYDPSHEKVLDMLRNDPSDHAFTQYTVKPGETFSSIARRVYQDKDMAFMIAYFNDLDPGMQPTVGTKLQCPHLDRSLSTKFKLNIEQATDSVLKWLIEKEYQKALTVIKKLQNQNAMNNKTIQLKNEIYYQLAIKQLQDQQFLQAFKHLQNIHGEYKDVRQVKMMLNRHLKEKAEQYYQRGVRYYDNGELKKAIKDFKIVLEFNPDHAQARQTLSRARDRLEQNQKARE
jgi:tetratricopeptide (TPR) repeat protein